MLPTLWCCETLPGLCWPSGQGTTVAGFQSDLDWFPGCTPVASPQLCFLESLVGTERPLISWFYLLKDAGTLLLQRCEIYKDNWLTTQHGVMMTPLAADACYAFILNSIKVALRRSNLDLNDRRQLSKVIPDLCRLLRARFALCSFIHSDDHLARMFSSSICPLMLR